MSLQPVHSGVLPSLEAEATPHGMRVVRRISDGMLGHVLTWVGGGLVTVVAGTIALVMILTGVGVGPAITPIVFSAAGLIVLGLAANNSYLRATLGDAEVLLPHLPLRLGDSVVVRYRQPWKGQKPVTAMNATLTVREWVRYRQGTDTRTDTHQLWQTDLPAEPGDPVGTGDLLRGAWRLSIPKELPPSFSSHDNALEWRLRLHADIRGRPDVINSYLLPVAPEVINDLA